MRDYILENISAAYLTDANGNPTPIDILDWNGVSLLSGTTFQVPNTFATNQWSVATGSNPAEINITISVLPANNGSAITAIQYRVGTGAWVTLPEAATGTYPVTMPATSTPYSISLRAINVVGPSAQSAAKTATSGAPAATAPAAFGPAQWTLATGTEPASLTLNILSLPNNGGSAITGIEYRVGSGEWAAFADAETGPRSLTMEQGGTAYSVTIRAVNAVNAGPASAAKTATSAAPAQQAPSVQTAPTISGGTTVGSILTRTAGTASGIPVPARATVWLRNGTILDGQTGNSLDTSGFASDDVIVTRDVWTNSQGSASGTSEPWILTVQPAITATPPALTAGQPASITFNEAPDAVTVTQGGAVLPSQRVGETTEWTFTPVTGQAVSITATKTGWTAYSAPDLPVDATWLAIPTQGGLTIHAMPAAQRLTGTSGTGSISITGTTAGGGTAPDLDGANVVLVTDGDWSGDDIVYATRETLPFLVAGLVDGEYIISNTDANPTPITVADDAPAELTPDVFYAQTDTPLENFVGASGEAWTKIYDLTGSTNDTMIVGTTPTGRLHAGRPGGDFYVRGPLDRGLRQFAEAPYRSGTGTATRGHAIGVCMNGQAGYILAHQTTDGAGNPGKLILYRSVAGSATLTPLSEWNADVPTGADRTKRLEVDLSGTDPVLTAYADGVALSPSYTDTNAAKLSGGGVGVRAAVYPAQASSTSGKLIGFHGGAF